MGYISLDFVLADELSERPPKASAGMHGACARRVTHYWGNQQPSENLSNPE